VAQTGALINVADAYAIGVHETRAFNRDRRRSDYSTRSVLVPPARSDRKHRRRARLLKAIDDSGATFIRADHEKLIRALASRRRRPAATPDRGSLVPDGLTELYNRPLTSPCGSTRSQAHTRFGHPSRSSS